MEVNLTVTPSLELHMGHFTLHSTVYPIQCKYMDEETMEEYMWTPQCLVCKYNTTRFFLFFYYFQETCCPIFQSITYQNCSQKLTFLYFLSFTIFPVFFLPSSLSWTTEAAPCCRWPHDFFQSSAHKHVSSIFSFINTLIRFSQMEL